MITWPKEITVNRDAQGFDENSIAAKAGGKIAGDARRELEQESKKSVVSKENFLNQLEQHERAEEDYIDR